MRPIEPPVRDLLRTAALQKHLVEEELHPTNGEIRTLANAYGVRFWMK